MTTLPSRLPYVIDGLVIACRAVAGHRDPEATTTGTPVFDGPEYGISADLAGTWLCIGWSGDPDAPEDGGDAGQVIAALGNRQREEAALIKCRAVSQSGDRDMQARRNAAFAEMAIVETILRADPRIGLDPSWMREAEIGERYRYRQQYEAGAVFTLDFAVAYRARI